MKALVVYDTVYGNTKQIAEAVAGGIGSDTKIARAGQVDEADLRNVDLLVVGSPTLGGRASEPMQGFLAGLSNDLVKGKRFATFDTRYSGKFVKLFGFAAIKMAEALTAKGGVQTAPPEAFFVTGKQGPLKEGEGERAARWAKDLAKS
jgi:flavodoxin